MGRFKDLWASGKFILKDTQEQDRLKQQQALHRFEELSPELAVPEGTRAIFDALKSRRGDETGRWLRDMAPKQPAREVLAVAKAKVHANTFEDTVVWMDALFKDFEGLVYEFNKTAVGSDLMVSHVDPVVSEKKGVDDEWFSSVSQIYQGRMMTRQWALIVRGRNDGISILLLPAVMLLAFTAGQVPDDEYPPFMEILRSAATGAWTIGGQAIPLSAIAPLAKELLGDLIRVSSGVMSQSELFSRNNDKPILGENLAVGYKQQASPQADSAGAGSVDQAGSERGAGSRNKTEQEEMSMPDACDVVDSIIDRELKQLYAKAAKLLPTSTNADATRKQISAIEGFRVKMMEAFSQYTQLTQPLCAPEAAKPEVELLRYADSLTKPRRNS